MDRLSGGAERRSPDRYRLLFRSAASVLLVGCTGNIGGLEGQSSGHSSGTGTGSNDFKGDVAQACAAQKGALEIGVTKLRRLTRDQLGNTMRDLLAVDVDVADTLAPDERIGPFDSNAIAPITDLIVQQTQELAVRIAADAKGRMNQISPCDLAADSATSCATRFVQQFGQKAFRRPLESSEQQGLVALYSLGKQSGGAANGFRLVVEAIVQSPSFLYHADAGVSGVPSATPEPLEPYALASRLSYFLWNSTPDDKLFALAGDKTLSTKDVLTAQVQRMLDDPRAATTLALFHRQWLEFGDLGDATKDPTLYPSFNPQLVDAMLGETARFGEQVVLRGDGLLSTLLAAPFSFPEGPLFDLYGIPQPPAFQVGARAELDPSKRAGILTQPAFLTKWAHNNQTAPVQRGIVVRENMMCQPIPPPPANVNANPPPPTDAKSTRQRFADHESNPTCAGCHTLIDRIGLGFEHYDAIGAYRTKDGLGPVDATGEILSARADLAGSFDGAVELAGKLAKSTEVAECVARQWFRFALGRVESENDACSLQAIDGGFRASGNNVRALLAQVALSDAFRNVRLTAVKEMK